MNGEQEHASFRLQEATIADIHAAFASGELSARRLVELYLNRIDAYDRNGPQINSIITLNPRAIEEAEHWDAVLAESGVSAPLHGIPVVLKDQIDAHGMPTTLGSILLKDFFPDRRLVRHRQTEARRRHHPGQGHPRRDGRRGYPRLALRLNEESLRSRQDRRRLLGPDPEQASTATLGPRRLDRRGSLRFDGRRRGTASWV